jgi:serine protease Do
VRLAILLALNLALLSCARPVPADPYAELYRALRPSIVFLSMRAPSDDPKRHGQIDDAFGTAFVVASGDWGTLLLTARHVITDARNLRATFGDAAQTDGVRVIAQDKVNDLALLEAPHVKNVRPATLGDSAGVVAGQPVGVLGYPIPDAFEDEGLGRAASIYAGHVASIRRAGTTNEAIELDLPIVPGESGGPVFTLDGKVIGIAESRFEEEHEIGFATPIDLIKPFIERGARAR